MKKFAQEINRFAGPWAFLSNFYACPVNYEMVVYPSVEHAYQAAKTLDLELRKKLTEPTVTAGQAKRYGARLTKRGQQRVDWFEVNLAIMKELLVQKFSRSILKRKLLSTFGAQLVEGNDWCDNFFGVCSCIPCQEAKIEGQNQLGKLLMEVRTLYAKDPN
jgi:ribA/ribD-fused uncharacterized protein